MPEEREPYLGEGETIVVLANAPRGAFRAVGVHSLSWDASGHSMSLVYVDEAGNPLTVAFGIDTAELLRGLLDGGLAGAEKARERRAAISRAIALPSD